MEPTTPALHCSMTSLGLLMMNSGEPITGNDMFCNTGGNLDMGNDFQKQVLIKTAL